MERYSIRRRGEEPGTAPGNVVEVREKDGAAVRVVDEAQALAVLHGQLGAESSADGLDELIGSRLVDRELARAEETVRLTEVEAWARSMQEQYKPPFDWRMFCRFKGTTPERERERWRRIQAWKRVTGRDIDEDELRAFVQRTSVTSSVRRRRSHARGQKNCSMIRSGNRGSSTSSRRSR